MSSIVGAVVSVRAIGWCPGVLSSFLHSCRTSLVERHATLGLSSGFAGIDCLGYFMGEVCKTKWFLHTEQGAHLDDLWNHIVVD